MDADYRQAVNAAVRAYDQMRNAAFRRFSGLADRAMRMETEEGREAVDAAWRLYVDEMQEAGAALSLTLERLGR